jgi:UV DNA damage endonuclease
MKLGYCCICLSQPELSTNRSMVKRTFQQRGIAYASELALQNVRDLFQILQWNQRNDIKLFRMSSDMFPWASEYQLSDMPDYKAICHNLKASGDYAKKYDMRLTFHPGPFDVLCSQNPDVVIKTLRDLEIHGEIMDIMGLERSPYNCINIHCNGTAGGKQEAMDRFCQNFQLLSDAVKTRLTVENDDKASMYSVNDLAYIHQRIGIPIVFDYHHHYFCEGNLDEYQALKLAASTWPTGITPIVHYSESKALHENDSKIRPQAHSDYVNRLPDTYGLEVDVEIEAKAKDLAILPYIKSTCEYSGLRTVESYV